ncbi:MAG: hypothetical protein ABI880_02910 [Acidobacteriota bacterium]
MTTTRVGTAAALLASLALSVTPAAAQERSREGEQRSGQSRGERRRPSGDGNRDANRGEARGGQAQGGQAREGQAQNNGGDRGQRREAVPRAEARDRNDGRRNGNDRGRYDSNRDRDRGRPVVIVPQYRNRGYNSRPNYARPYYSRPRVYAVPYGYRPRGYRPGWSLNLYFGRPYGNYGSGGYYGNGNYGGNYGYYAIPQGFAYGSVRIVDAPRDAQVFVDGYYAGVVDDYDGVFQRLNMEPGSHHIEVQVDPNGPPIEFDVHVEPGQTVTYHARY